MDPITPGSTGAAVEDIQERLVKLGYTIEDDERQSHTFGKSTARAVARFRLDHDLSWRRSRCLYLGNHGR